MKRKILSLLLSLMVTLSFVLPGCTPAAPPPAGATGVPAPAPVKAPETLEWKWNSYYASGDFLIEQDYYVAKKITELTGGRFTFKIFPSGQLTSSLECAASISSGAFPIGSAHAPAGTRDFACNSFAYYFTPQDYQNWWFTAGGKQLSDKMHADKFNNIFFPCNIISCDSGWRSNKPLVKMEDFKGMKIRCGAIETQDIVKLWGGSAMFLSGNDIYQAAKLGTIDAFEFVTPPVDWGLGFHEVSKYWVYPAWYQTFTAYGVTVNLDAWKKLPKDFQAAIRAATQMGIIRMQGRAELQNAEYTQKFIDYGIITTGMSAQLFKDLIPVVKDTIEKSAAQNQNTAANYDSVFKYLKKVNVWKRLEVPWTYGMVLDDKDYPVIKPEWLPDWYKANPEKYDYRVSNAPFAMPEDWE